MQGDRPTGRPSSATIDEERNRDTGRKLAATDASLSPENVVTNQKET